VAQIVDAAHRDGSLAQEVTFADIGMLLVRLARPLPGQIPPELNDTLAHRHLELIVEGHRQQGTRHAGLPGPALSRDDLHAIRAGQSTSVLRRKSVA